MVTFSRILFPVAFSERCRAAARYAGALACHFHSELVLLHVVAPSPSGLGGGSEAIAYSAPLSDEMLEQSKAELGAFLSEELQGLNVTRIVLEGDPARTIVQYAHAKRFDLIVMATHGHGPFRRFLLGSVTAKVLHDADCPVWTGSHMQASTRESASFRRILCAVDLGPQSLAIVDWATRMAAEFNSEMAIVHAIRSRLANSTDTDLDSEWCVREASAAREHILWLQESTGSKGEIYIEEGEAPGAISEAARRLHADLLVIGRGLGCGLVGRLRANAYAILRESPCAVLSI